MKLGKQPVLLLIDVQKGFRNPKWGVRNNLAAEKNLSLLLNEWRQKQLPIIHVQHLSTGKESPLRPGQDGCEFMEEVQPLSHEKVVQKNVNSAFIGTDLENYLRDHDFNTLVIGGLTTNHCVSTTTRMASNLGFNPYVLSDGTAAFDVTSYDGTHFSAEQIHQVALANLHQEFAEITSTERVLTVVRSTEGRKS